MDQIVTQDSSSHPSRMRAKARQLLQDIDIEQLPTLPNILLSLLKTSHDTASPERLANDIEKDPALRIRLLSINQYNSNKNNDSTAQILRRLDKHTLRNLAITSTAQQYFAEQSSPEQTKFLKQHWQHSLLCAFIAKAIAEQCEYQYPEEAYTAGLLHDIGELVLHCAYPDIYNTLNTHDDEDVALHDLEKNEFSCNHLYLGAELLKLYQVNSFISDAILYHHEPIDQILDAHPLVKIVHFANQLSNTDFNIQSDHADSDIFDHGNEMFGFSRATIIGILGLANEQLNKCVIEFEIDLDMDGDEANNRQIQARAEYVQTQLDEQIKYISLLDGLHQQLSRTRSPTDLFNAIEQYTNLLFGIDQNILFLYHAEQHQICAVASKNNHHFADLKIPLKENRSIISDCLLKNEALHSFAHQYNKLNIIDQQILSATDKQGMVCLPLIDDGNIVGVLVLGIEHQQQANVWKQLPLLQHFGKEIAHTLYCQNLNGDDSSAHWGQFESHIREVIHEVNNPLSIINNYLEILSLKLGKDNQAHTDIQTIKGEIHRVGEILQRLKSPKTNLSSIEKTDINELLTELTQVFEASFLSKHHIQLDLDLDTDLPLITCHANTLKQIYTNLIKNAAEALPEKGQIMVYTQGQVNVDGQSFIEICVADNGPGIRSEVLQQLFKPVQTEKGDDHAGIGLSIVKKLVTELNGSISCRSNTKGTSFQIRLPNK